MAKVLISDKMHSLAEEIFKKQGIDVDVKTGLSEDELAAIIGDYDGLAIRSSTTVTPKILDAAKNLKVVGRAGIGVDNVDIKYATNKGIIVMNTPFGNSVTTAEHAIAMMFSIARQLPQANESTQAGKWEKSKFMGTEVTNKTLGIIGCGNIGSIVAARAIGLKMKVIAFDPFLTNEKAEQLGVTKVELDKLFNKSDFITLHIPLNDKTKNIINKAAIAKMKDGVFIINCARGGLVNEEDLREALDSGKVAGAAMDVFTKEPATENILFGSDRLVATPHLGASTNEAQENVAIQVAEQIADFLNHGVIENSVNIASVSKEDAKKLNPYIELGDFLGNFAGQIAEGAIKEINISYQGDITKYNTKPVTAMITKSILQNNVEGVNIVNSQAVATERGIKISETDNNANVNYSCYVSINIKTEQSDINIGGTIFADKPRLIAVNKVTLEATPASHMLYVENQDKPGLIGNLGKLLGDENTNIANFHLGRNSDKSGSAIALLDVDSEISDEIIDIIKNMPTVIRVKYLKF